MLLGDYTLKRVGKILSLQICIVVLIYGYLYTPGSLVPGQYYLKGGLYILRRIMYRSLHEGTWFCMKRLKIANDKRIQMRVIE